MTHRCAVCWELFKEHDKWFQHAVDIHSAVLAEFGYDRCKKESCPGVEHVKLKAEGQPVRRKPRPTPQPFTARDGTTYTLLELPP